MNESDIEWFRSQTKAQIDQIRADILAHHQTLHGTAAERGTVEKLEAARKHVKALHKEIERLRLLVDGDTHIGVSGLRSEVVALSKEIDTLERQQEQQADELEKREARRAIRDELVTWSLRAFFVYVIFDLLRGLIELISRYR